MPAEPTQDSAPTEGAPRRALAVVAGFIDRYIAIFVVLGMLSISGLGLEVLHLVEEQKAGIQSQLVNRATNVEAWCNGINGGRDYNRVFVKHVTDGRVQYTLADLPCEELIRKTLESPKHKHPVTAAEHPLTYRVLHELKTGR